MATEDYAGFTGAEIDRIVKSTNSNTKTVRKWIRDLGLQCMTTTAVVRAIKQARADGIGARTGR